MSVFYLCEGLPMPADSVPLLRRQIWADLAPHVVDTGVRWPQFSEPVEQVSVYLRGAGTLEGPGTYGHMGIAGYRLVIDSIFEVRRPGKDDCK